MSRSYLPVRHLQLLRIVLIWQFVLLAGCNPPPPTPGPEPLDTFEERVAALVTTTTRGFLRDRPAAQAILNDRLPNFRQAPTLVQLLLDLQRPPELRELPPLIQNDIEFELEKPEYDELRERWDTPEVQQETVAAVTLGMERGLAQLTEPGGGEAGGAGRDEGGTDG